MNPADDFAGEGQILLLNKPKGWTSFDVVAKIRNLIGGRKVKVGHAGTLDPLAEGLLILCTGKKTKEISQFSGMDKEYEAEIRFGAVTKSYDSEFPPEMEKITDALSRSSIEKEMTAFQGEIFQTPPAFSAVRKDGKRAYELARKGKSPELEPRKIRIHEFLLLDFIPPGYGKVFVKCSKGTYIRSLIHDLGQALGTGAYLTGLRRTAIGPYRLENAREIAEFQALFSRNGEKSA